MHIPSDQLLTDYGVYDVDLGPYVYGLRNSQGADTRFTVFAAPTATFCGFDKPPALVSSSTDPRHQGWEIERFLRLVLTGDPHAVECLWSPTVHTSNDIGEGLLTLRPHLVSRVVYRTFLAEANTQVDRLGSHTDAIDYHRAASMLRLLLSVEQLLRTGEPLLRTDSYRNQLLSVQKGNVSWSQIRRWRDDLTVAAQDALSRTVLPQQGDREVADRFLVEVRRRMV